MAKKLSAKAHQGDRVQRAVALAAQGKELEAFEFVQTHLRGFPRDADALNLAGTLAARTENWFQAEKYFTATLALNPTDTYALRSLAKVFKRSNRVDAAIDALSRFLQIEPRQVSALDEMGALLVAQGHIEPAVQAFRAAIEIDPSFEAGYRNLYAALYSCARYEEAGQVASRAIEQVPPDARWSFRTDLILCLLRSQEVDGARQLAERVIGELEHSDDPRHREYLPYALNNYGVTLMEMDEAEAAEAQFKKINALSPKMVEPYVNLAKLAVYREDFQSALDYYDKALAIAPENAEVQNQFAIFLREAGRPDLALPRHYAAIEQSPGDVEMRYYLGVTQFALGQLQEAYMNWEFRWARREGGCKSTFPIPEWTGEPATGRSLLVYNERGIGFEVLSANCLPDMAERFERVVCICHGKLKPLFARSFPQIAFRSGSDALSEGEIADMGWQIAMGSMASRVRPSVASFPHRTRLLVSDPEKTAHFCAQLAPQRAVLTVGIAWRSGLLSINRRALYPYLEFWQALFAIPGITWVNLQHGDVTEELKKAEQQFGVSIINFEDIDHFDDLDTSAALMRACDLVIGPATATTQIAAAVGTPTIRIYSGCDYLSLGTDYYPWLPSLNIIHRRFGEPWSEPIQRVANILKALAAEGGASDR